MCHHLIQCVRKLRSDALPHLVQSALFFPLVPLCDMHAFYAFPLVKISSHVLWSGRKSGNSILKRMQLMHLPCIEHQLVRLHNLA